MPNILRIATRNSQLALWQANEVARQLKSHYPDLNIQLVKMLTKGDKILDSPLSKIGGKGLFVKELEIGILENKADIAVHSMKDVPIEFPAGLHLPIILKRADPRDAFVSNTYTSLTDLPKNAVVGTSSLRRQAQLMAHFPQLKIRSLRGNVNTRLQKLDEGQYDAIILAAAGLKRLQFTDRIAQYISPEQSLPAIGQGAIGIECRQNDPLIEKLLAPLNHIKTTVRLTAERSQNKRLQGGCQVPMAGFAELIGDNIRLRGLIAKPDGSTIYRSEKIAPLADAEKLGIAVAEDLLSQGGDKILQQLGIM